MKKLHAGLWALAIKLGPKIATIGMKILKGAKIGKVGLATASVASYSYLYTWQFALGLVATIFIHECGHLWAMKRCGLTVKGLYLIPFVGGVAMGDGTVKTEKDHVFIALMGPIWGLVISAAFAIMYLITDDAMWAALAGSMAMVNLINLIPISPLDGGRVMKSIIFSIHTKLGLIYLSIALVLIGIGAISLHSWAFTFLLVIGSLELLGEWWNYQRGQKVLASKAELEEVIKKIDENELEEDEKLVLINAKKALKKAEQDILEAPSEIKKMSKLQIILSIVSLFLLAFVLWELAGYTSHVPEAELARQILLDEK